MLKSIIGKFSSIIGRSLLRFLSFAAESYCEFVLSTALCYDNYAKPVDIEPKVGSILLHTIEPKVMHIYKPLVSEDFTELEIL